MKLKNQSIVFKMTLLGLSLALYLVLSFASINLQFMKISMTGIPVIFIAVVFGPLEAALLGGVGEFFYQLLVFGLTPTTVLWMIPSIVRGLIVGLMFKHKDATKQIGLWIATVAICCLAVTVINTFVIWIDAVIFEYPSQLTALTIFFRFIGSIGSAIIYALIVPTLFQPLIKSGKFEEEFKDSDFLTKTLSKQYGLFYLISSSCAIAICITVIAVSIVKFIPAFLIVMLSLLLGYCVSIFVLELSKKKAR